MCGFPGALESKLTADRPNDAAPFTPESWAVESVQAGERVTLEQTDNSVVIIRAVGSGGFGIERFTHDGAPLGTFTIDFDRDLSAQSHDNGMPTVSADGSIYAIDTHGGRQQIVRFAQDGTRAESFDVPPQTAGVGQPLDLRSVVWVPDYAGQPALVIEDQNALRVFRTSGEELTDSAPRSGSLLGAAGDVVVSAEASDTVATVTGRDVTTDEEVVAFPSALAENAVTPTLGLFRGLVAGPDDNTFLLANGGGIAQVDAHGVRLATWTNGVAGLSISANGAIAEQDGHYWVLTPDDRPDHNGKFRILSLSRHEMSQALATPVTLTTGLEPQLAQLGMGIGPVTDAALSHFDPGETPRLAIRAEDGWGSLDGANAQNLELRYWVRGDPLLADPVNQEERRADAPIGGGETVLGLPEPRPGAYEVSIALVDTQTDAYLSATCARYSVAGAQALDIASLAPGSDWGGPGPLRGIQIADRLAIGSHRVQLNFGALIADPSGRPSAEGIDWTRLPGAADPADESSPKDSERAGFTGLVSAAREAKSRGTTLIIQVAEGGDAEKAAVEAGTWEGWIKLIAEGFSRNAPEVDHWSAWNEPNNTFGAGKDFATQVDRPFARAIHAVNVDATVIGGNTLGFAFDWWKEAADAGICDDIDAVGVHPYTGFNRSWEEEGFTAEGRGFEELASATGSSCKTLPVWDTETGWTGDGALAAWSQASNVARKQFWYAANDIAGWTYFFSEGGWGESDLSWSLIQVDSHVKPGGLAFATVGKILRERGKPHEVETSIPFTYQFAFDDGTSGAWAPGARMNAIVKAPGDSVTVTDVYGYERKIALTDGSADVVITPSPQFFSSPDGKPVTLMTAEAFGDDVLKGRPATASSTNADTDAQSITAGDVNNPNPWRSGRLEDGEVDPSPSVEITLEKPTTLNRISVATSSIVCCQTGLRDYNVSVQTPDGEWKVVAEQRNQFWERIVLFEFDAIEATAVRVEPLWTTVRGTKVLAVNVADYGGGLPPPFMGLKTESDRMAAIASISAWVPGSD